MTSSGLDTALPCLSCACWLEGHQPHVSGQHCHEHVLCACSSGRPLWHLARTRSTLERSSRAVLPRTSTPGQLPSTDSHATSSSCAELGILTSGVAHGPRQPLTGRSRKSTLLCLPFVIRAPARSAIALPMQVSDTLSQLDRPDMMQHAFHPLQNCSRYRTVEMRSPDPRRRTTHPRRPRASDHSRHPAGVAAPACAFYTLRRALRLHRLLRDLSTMQCHWGLPCTPGQS